MKHKKDSHKGRGVTRYTKEAERAFFFYATIVVFIVWICLKIMGD